MVQKVRNDHILMSLSLFLFATILITGFDINNLKFQSISTQFTEETQPLKALINHTPIIIENNAEFTPENGVIGGNGSRSNPWHIAGWRIIQNSTEIGISITHTTDYFIIENCEIGWTENMWGFGIQLSNVIHGEIRNNTLFGNYYGIYITQCSNVSVIYNRVTANCTDAIYTIWSNDIFVAYNSIFESILIGVELYRCGNISVLSNEIHQAEYPIWLYSSWQSTISHNRIQNAYPGQIYLSNTTNIVFIKTELF